MSPPLALPSPPPCLPPNLPQAPELGPVFPRHQEGWKPELETLDVPGPRSDFHTSCLVIFVASWAAVEEGRRRGRGKAGSQIQV